MNNAGIQPGSALFGPQANWDNVLGVNLMAVINGTRTFGPGMVAHKDAALIINTGSKQGIHHAAGRPGLQCLESGREGVHRSAPARAAQHAGLQRLFTPADPRLRLHRTDRKRPHGEAVRRMDAEETVEFMLESLVRATSTFSARTTRCPAPWTRSVSPGLPATSSKTAHRCRAGIRIMPMPSRPTCRSPKADWQGHRSPLRMKPPHDAGASSCGDTNGLHPEPSRLSCL